MTPFTHRQSVFWEPLPPDQYISLQAEATKALESTDFSPRNPLISVSALPKDSGPEGVKSLGLMSPSFCKTAFTSEEVSHALEHLVASAATAVWEADKWAGACREGVPVLREFAANITLIDQPPRWIEAVGWSHNATDFWFCLKMYCKWSHDL